MEVHFFIQKMFIYPLCVPENILGTRNTTKIKIYQKKENNANYNNLSALLRAYSMHDILLTVFVY